MVADGTEASVGVITEENLAERTVPSDGLESGSFPAKTGSSSDGMASDGIIATDGTVGCDDGVADVEEALVSYEEEPQRTAVGAISGLCELVAASSGIWWTGCLAGSADDLPVLSLMLQPGLLELISKWMRYWLVTETVRVRLW